MVAVVLRGNDMMCLSPRRVCVRARGFSHTHSVLIPALCTSAHPSSRAQTDDLHDCIITRISLNPRTR